MLPLAGKTAGTTSMDGDPSLKVGGARGIVSGTKWSATILVKNVPKMALEGDTMTTVRSIS